jgi:5'(3')-deoxyribonucleotidase
MDTRSYVAMLESYVRAREPDYSKPHTKGGDLGYHHNRNGEKVYWRKDGKVVLLLDMDGVLADFEGSLREVVHDPPEMFQKDFFLNLQVKPGAKEFVEWAMAQPSLEVYIASKPLTWKVFYSATEKMEWVNKNLPSLNGRVNLVCNKGLLLGDILVDDDDEAWKGKFMGEFFHFDKANPAESFKKLKEHLQLQYS